MISLFVLALVGNVLRMKTPLKYAHTSRELVQLHIGSCARQHFYRLFDVLFSLQLCPVHVCTGRDTVCVHICTERDTGTLHRVIFELTSHGFAVVYRFRHADRSADRGPERAQH